MKITIHMVASADGFIAKKDNSVSWFETQDHYEKGVPAAADISAYAQAVDCYIMGARTYEHAHELSKEYGWPYGDVPTIVLTGRKLTADRANIEFYAGDLDALVNEKLQGYKNVWVVGGAMLTKEFLRLKLADEIRIPILPILLGDGLRFFDQVGVEQALHLKDSIAYDNGMVELCYEIKK